MNGSQGESTATIGAATIIAPTPANNPTAGFSTKLV
jgi:hypothetical protein